VESPVLNADRKDNRPGSGISLQTLIIASLASAAAAFAASRIWGKGTLISAAATPVVVALVSEFLRRPVQTVATTAKKVPTVQTLPAVRTRTIAAPEDPSRVNGDPTIPAEPPSPSVPARPRRRVEPPAAITPNVEPIKYYGKADTWRPRWRPALATGLVAFAIVVALYTLPDLLAGRSITGNGQPTTFFGASANVKKKTSPTTTVTTTTPTMTATKTAPTTTATKTAPTTTTTTTTTRATSTTNTTTPTSRHSTTTPTTSTKPPAVNPTTTPTTPAP
jgi:hypothetical protein